MTEPIKDGGPAFPIFNDSDFNGMSLRDAFAISALQGELSGSAGTDGNSSYGGVHSSFDWLDRQVFYVMTRPA